MIPGHHSAIPTFPLHTTPSANSYIKTQHCLTFPHAPNAPSRTSTQQLLVLATGAHMCKQARTSAHNRATSSTTTPHCPPTKLIHWNMPSPKPLVHSFIQRSKATSELGGPLHGVTADSRSYATNAAPLAGHFAQQLHIAIATVGSRCGLTTTLPNNCPAPIVTRRNTYSAAILFFLCCTRCSCD